MDNDTELDPWANMGNMGLGNHSGETNPEALARAEEWEKAMADVAFSGEDSPQPFNTETITDAPTEQAPEADNYNSEIADASAIINYGLNAAAKEKGVETVIQAINNFVPDGKSDPIKQLFYSLGIDNTIEMNNISDESRAIKSTENAFRAESINAPTTLNHSRSGAINAIKEVKELVAEVQTAPEYAELRANALKNGKGVFEYAVNEYGVRDLTVLFNALNAQKKTATAEESPQAPKLENEEKDDDQTENQSSTLNSSPETDATASKESLL